MTKRVLYLHGFASSPHGQKVEKLRVLLGPEFELVAPDLNAPSFAKLDFDAIVERALAAAREVRPHALAGSSLGALATLAVASKGVDAPLVLIAPAVGFGDRWIARPPAGDPLDVFHHAEGRAVPIHRAFFEQMARVTVDREPPSMPVVAIMGRDDESVPFEQVETTWRRWELSGRLAQGSRLIEVAGGDHRLIEHTALIAGEIALAARSAAERDPIRP